MWFKIVSILLVVTMASFAEAYAKTLKIGSMGPLTGPYAADGHDIKNGVLCAIEAINDEGGLPGYDRIKLFPQDTACDPKQAVAAANKLINIEVAGVIGAYCSSSTIPASATLAEEDIVMITPASTHADVTDRGLPYMFRMCGRDDDQAPSAVKFMKDGLGARSVFIVDDKTTYSQGVADGVRRHAKKNGIRVLGHDHVNQGDKDFSAVLTTIKRANPDVFYMSLQNHASGSLMVIQAKQLGLRTNILTQDAMYHPDFIKIAGRNAEGVFVTYGYTDLSTPAFKSYKRRYIAKYGKASKNKIYTYDAATQKLIKKDDNKIGAYGTYAYDAAMAYFRALKMAGTTHPAKVKNALLKLDYQGASKRVRFGPKGDSGSSYVVFKIQNGRYALNWRPDSGKAPVYYAQRPNKNTQKPIRQQKPVQKKPQKVMQRDTAPPRIKILSHDASRGIKIGKKNKHYLVRGRVTDESGVVTVLVDNREVPLDMNGRFSAKVFLGVGNNRINVRAMDRYENWGGKTFSIFREASVPVAEKKAVTSQSGNYYALVIGINDYRYLQRLETAVNDAKAVSRLLENDYNFQTKLLINANRRKILGAINSYRKKLQKEDHFLLYYAGHGYFDVVAQKAYWLPVEANTESDIDWIMADSLTSNMRRISANHILVVADSCYSGTLTRSAIGGLKGSEERDRFIAKMLRKSSRTLIASGGNEPVSDGGGGGHSIFARAFIDGLRSMDFNVFTAEELYFEHIKERVSGNSEQTPEYNTIRNSGHSGGDFIFVKIR